MTFLYVKPPQGNRVAIMGLGGGTSVASADVCNAEGLGVPALTESTQAELKKFIPLAGASVRNPMDTGLAFRDMSLLERELELVAADPLIDMIIVRPHLDMTISAGPGQVDRMINYLSDFCRSNSYGKPTVIVFHSWANDPREVELRARLQLELPKKGVVVYSSLTAGCRALAKLLQYHQFQRKLAADSR